MPVIPGNKRTHEQNVINGRKGGLKAAENRRKLIEHNSVTRADLLRIDADIETVVYWLNKIVSGRFDYDYYNGDVQIAAKSLERIENRIIERRAAFMNYDTETDAGPVTDP